MSIMYFVGTLALRSANVTSGGPPRDHRYLSSNSRHSRQPSPPPSTAAILMLFGSSLLASTSVRLAALRESSHEVVEEMQLYFIKSTNSTFSQVNQALGRTASRRASHIHFDLLPSDAERTILFYIHKNSARFHAN